MLRWLEGSKEVRYLSDDVLHDIATGTYVVGVVGERGMGKSWVLTLLSEIAVMAGDWRNIVWDTKGDDTGSYQLRDGRLMSSDQWG